MMDEYIRGTPFRAATFQLLYCIKDTVWSVFFGEDGCGDGAMQQEGRIATRLASERGRARATQDPRDACPPSASSERASELGK